MYCGREYLSKYLESTSQTTFFVVSHFTASYFHGSCTVHKIRPNDVFALCVAVVEFVYPQKLNKCVHSALGYCVMFGSPVWVRVCVTMKKSAVCAWARFCACICVCAHVCVCVCTHVCVRAYVDGLGGGGGLLALSTQFGPVTRAKLLWLPILIQTQHCRRIWLIFNKKLNGLKRFDTEHGHWFCQGKRNFE